LSPKDNIYGQRERSANVLKFTSPIIHISAAPSPLSNVSSSTVIDVIRSLKSGRDSWSLKRLPGWRSPE